MIEVQRVHFAYPGASCLFTGLEMQVQQGEILGIVGPNGAGKSTLLKLLRGRLVPQQGAVYWPLLGSWPVHRLRRHRVAAQAAVVPQTAAAAFGYTVWQLVAMGRYAQPQLSGQREQAIVEQALALTDTWPLRQRTLAQLSGGEQQRVLVARALVQQTPVLLLDEPTSSLDLRHQRQLLDLLVRLNGQQGKTIVHICHDLAMAAEISHRVLLLGAEAEDWEIGSPAEVMTEPKLQQALQVPVQVFPHPLTGRPQITTSSAMPRSSCPAVSIHLLCGGGSAGDLLRPLHMAGHHLTLGPLNMGDSDRDLALALGLPVITEKPFSPLSQATLQEARQWLRSIQVLVVAPTAWGWGNEPQLALAEEALTQGKKVVFVGQHAQLDYTGGRAWQRIRQLYDTGAWACASIGELVEALTTWQQKC